MEVLSEVDGHPVVIREGSVLACAFHPELTDDPRLHALLMAMAIRERIVVPCGNGRAMNDPRVLNLAKILVRYSTSVGEGDTCLIEGPTAAEPLIAAVYDEVLKAGGQPVLAMAFDSQPESFYRHATDAQLEWISPVSRMGRRGGGLPDRDRRRRKHASALLRPARSPDEAPGGNARASSSR